MFARTFAVLTLGAGFALTAAACTSNSTPDAAATVAPTVASAAASAAPSPAASSAPAPATSTKPASSTDGCPATEATLLAAWEVKYGHKPTAGTQLTRISCHDGWAIAAREVPKQESEVEAFHFVSGEWKYLTGGSGGYCTGIPAAVQKYFNAHGPQGCDSASL